MNHVHYLHKATHFDSTATNRTEEQALCGRQVAVRYKQNPRYKMYRNNPQPA